MALMLLSVSLAMAPVSTAAEERRLDRPPPYFQIPQPEITTPLAPPRADPRDLNGVWWPQAIPVQVFPMNTNERPPFTPAAALIFKHRFEMNQKGMPVPDAAVNCRPMGPRIVTSPYALEIVQNKDKIVFFFEENHNVQRVYMNAKHPANPEPSYGGHSTGRWEGDTLVIETSGFNGKTWLDSGGTPHSDRLRMVRRIRKIEGGAKLEELVTITDPVMFTRPFTYQLIRMWRPDKILEEYICETNMHDARLQAAHKDLSLPQAMQALKK